MRRVRRVWLDTRVQRGQPQRRQRLLDVPRASTACQVRRLFLPRLLVVCGRRRVSHVKLSVVVEVVVVVVFAFGFEWESRRCDLGRLDGHIEAL